MITSFFGIFKTPKNKTSCEFDLGCFPVILVYSYIQKALIVWALRFLLMILANTHLFPHKGSVHDFYNEIEFSNIINDHKILTFQSNVLISQVIRFVSSQRIFLNGILWPICEQNYHYLTALDAFEVAMENRYQETKLGDCKMNTFLSEVRVKEEYTNFLSDGVIFT